VALAEQADHLARPIDNQPCFASPQDFALAPLPAQTAGSDVPEGHKPTVAERLQRIQKRRDQGTITDEEYEHYRREILNDL
jgi:hypothetical protein